MRRGEREADETGRERERGEGERERDSVPESVWQPHCHLRHFRSRYGIPYSRPASCFGHRTQAMRTRNWRVTYLQQGAL